VTSVTRSSRTWLFVTTLIVGVGILIGLVTWMANASTRAVSAQQQGLSTVALTADANQLVADWHAGSYAAVWRRFDRASKHALPESRFLNAVGACAPEPVGTTVVGVSTGINGYEKVRVEGAGRITTTHWDYADGTWEYAATASLSASTLRCLSTH